MRRKPCTDSSRSLAQIWLGGQTLMGIELGWAGEKWVGPKGPGIGGGVRGAVIASYHTYVPGLAKQDITESDTRCAIAATSPPTPPFLACPGWSPSSGCGNAGCTPSTSLRQQSAAACNACSLLCELLVTLCRCKLYLCPSQSTQDMLASHGLPHSRPWSRGVDLTHFNPARRSTTLRRQWGIQPVGLSSPTTVAQSRLTVASKLPLLVGGLVTPPMSPEFGATDDSSAAGLSVKDSRLAVLYVGRV